VLVKRLSRISRKNQVTLPVAILRQAELAGGDRVSVSVDEQGRITLQPVRTPPDYRRFIGRWQGRSDYHSGAELVEEVRGPFSE
jgi:AbrB family looped-hinge helix DNA binding protein